MKRKFLSTLLFGALACTTLSTVTSCKDYDDDISANAQEISSLKTTVSNLQTALDQAKADATAALANYATKTELGNVSNSVSALQDAVAKLVTADQLQKALDEAKAALETKASQEDLDKVSQTVAAINADLDAIKTWQKTTDSAIETANKNIEAQKEALDELKKALEGKSSTEDLNALAKVVEGKADAADLEVLQKKIEAIENAGYDLDELAKTFAKVSDLADLKKEMQDANAALDKKVGAQINILSVFIKKQLTSLVFKPAYMFDGIEGDILPAMVNPSVYKFKTGEDSLVLDKTITGESIYPKSNIYYHFNPSSADLTDWAIQFYNIEPTVATRAEGVNTNLKPANAKLSNTDKVGNGIVKVEVANNKETWEKMQEIKDDKIPMFALQATKGDTIVNSDYAYLKAVNYKNLVLADTKVGKVADAKPFESMFHLVQTFEDAKDLTSATEVHQVMYNNHDVDLKSFINTHVTLKAPKGEDGTSSEIEVTDSMLNVLGLSYHFKAIQYTDGDEETSQSLHLKVADNGKACVMEVGADGKVVGPNEKKGAVGREPIVMVTLTNAKGDIYAYGFIKVRIVEEEAEASDAAVTFANTIYANCGVAGEASLTWAQAENQLLNSLNISHNTFKAKYVGHLTADQYVKVNGNYVKVADNNKAITDAILKSLKKGGAAVSAEDMIAEFYAQGGVGYIEATAPTCADGKITDAAAAKFDIEHAANAWGTVSENAGDDAPNTTLLTWKFTDNDYAALASIAGFVNPTTGKSTKPVQTYVKYDDEKGNMLYVALNLPTEGMQFVAGTVGTHIAAKWFAAESNKEGNAEIHANVVVPKNGTEMSTFDFDMLSTFTGNKVSIALVDNKKLGSEALTTYLNEYKFYFNASKYDAQPDANKQIKAPKVIVKGASGATYAIVIDEANTTLKAIKGEPNKDGVVEYINKDAQDVVKLTSNKNNTASYQVDNTYAQDILNYAGHKDLKNTFGAYVILENADGSICYKPFLNNTENFVVRFLRPVNGYADGEATVSDAVDGGDKVDIMKMIKIDDWRDFGITYADAQTKTMHQSYVTYYGIQVTYDASKARTDEAESNRTKLTDADQIAKLGLLSEIDNQIQLVPKASQTFAPTWVEETYKKDASGEYVLDDNGNKIVIAPAHWAAMELTYSNNQAVTNDFHIYVPITVTYKFGAVKTFYGVITVKSTLNQNAKKH